MKDMVGCSLCRLVLEQLQVQGSRLGGCLWLSVEVSRGWKSKAPYFTTKHAALVATSKAK